MAAAKMGPERSDAPKIGSYYLGNTLGHGTFGKVKGKIFYYYSVCNLSDSLMPLLLCQQPIPPMFFLPFPCILMVS